MALYVFVCRLWRLEGILGLGVRLRLWDSAQYSTVSRKSMYAFNPNENGLLVTHLGKVKKMQPPCARPIFNCMSPIVSLSSTKWGRQRD
jgi:hypothetical protein